MILKVKNVGLLLELGIIIIIILIEDIGRKFYELGKGFIRLCILLLMRIFRGR